jgi:crotonobetainyl-CoA:carnitine CoA-transferase CaiB-like acyl-CoA transferase
MPDDHNNLPAPLAGIRVLDIATLLAAPRIAMTLGDYGAEVVKVEHPRGDALRQFGWLDGDTSLWWKFLARNKKGITLNLSHARGQTLFMDLIQNFDILIENFRPGTMERWGLGYDALSEVNERLIMVRVTGFGQTGPYRDKPGFGTLAEAMSTFAYCNGSPDGPPILPPGTLADSVAGLTGTIAVMMALYHRDMVSGQGQYIDLSIVEPLFELMGPQPAVYEKLGVVPTRTGNTLPFAAPRNMYKTKDGRWVALSASAQSVAERVMKVIGRPDLIDDPRFKNNETRVENRGLLDELIGNWIGNRTYEEVLACFAEHDAALAPVYSIEDIMNDPHYRARNAVIEIPDPDQGTLKVPNIPVRLSRTPGRIYKGAPKLGADNREIYINELGLSEEELHQLKEERVI